MAPVYLEGYKFPQPVRGYCGGFGNVPWQIFIALLTFAKTGHSRIQNLCLYGPTHLVTEEADDDIRPKVSEVW